MHAKKIQQAHLALMTAAAVGTLSTQLQGAVVGVAAGIIAFLEKSRMQHGLFTRQVQDKNSSEHQSAMVTLFSHKMNYIQRIGLPFTIYSWNSAFAKLYYCILMSSAGWIGTKGSAHYLCWVWAADFSSPLTYWSEYGYGEASCNSVRREKPHPYREQSCRWGALYLHAWKCDV